LDFGFGTKSKIQNLKLGDTMFTNNALLTIGLASLLTGLAVGGLLYALMIFSNEQDARINRRVKRYTRHEGKAGANTAIALERQRTALFAEMDKRWKGRSVFKSVQREIQGAGMSITASELVAMQLALGLGLAVVLGLLVKPFGVLLAPLCLWAGAFFVRWYVRFKAKRRVARFEDQLPNSLAILAGSVRGGFSLFQALQMISRESDEPSKTEYTRVIQEISLGNPMSTALEGLSQRIPTEDVDILVTAITMQQHTGGNLTHVLDVVAATVRERHRVKREIKSLTSQQRISAIMLGSLPFLLTLALYVINPKYVGKLFEPGWVLCMPIGAFVLTIIGFFLMRKMADIDV
jgi:tight adherence protein B